MTELFDEDDGELLSEEALVASDEDVVLDDEDMPDPSDARRRLEQMLDDRRLQAELEDFLDE